MLVFRRWCVLTACVLVPQAKLVSVPVYPWWVVGGLFALGLLAVLVVYGLPVFTFAHWF